MCTCLEAFACLSCLQPSRALLGAFFPHVLVWLRTIPGVCFAVQRERDTKSIGRHYNNPFPFVYVSWWQCPSSPGAPCIILPLSLSREGDLRVLRHDKSVLHPLRKLDHLKHIPDYLMPRGLQTGEDPTQVSDRLSQALM